MKVHQFLKIGSSHRNFCEDFNFVEQFDKNHILAGVFDGCSSGKDSHFASSFMAKIIRAEAQKAKSEIRDANFLKNVLFRSLLKLKSLKSDLKLETNELLSTIILFFADIETQTGEIVIFGDGFISVNGEKTIIDQDNTPQYAAYFLEEITDFESFENIFKNNAFYLKMNELKDITISTDGILSFAKTDMNEAEIKPEDYLATNLFLNQNPAMFGRKINLLKSKYDLVNQDDLGIIRVIFEIN